METEHAKNGNALHVVCRFQKNKETDFCVIAA